MKSDRGWLPGERDVDWIDSIAQPLSPALAAMEAAATASPQRIPIVDRDTGRVLSALAAGRRRIVEVGTAYGYSTLWLALGQPGDGTIVTIDPDRSRTDLARAGGGRPAWTISRSPSSLPRPSMPSPPTSRRLPDPSIWLSSTP